MKLSGCILVLTIFVGLVASLPKDISFITLRTQSMQKTGRLRWDVNEQMTTWKNAETAMMVVDMWNQHWCPSATHRVGGIAVRINQTITAARDAGIFIIHAPSDCSSYYADYKAREWVMALPNATIPKPKPHNNPDYPIDASDQGCDVPGYTEHRTWTHENDLITIYDEDAIIDDNAQEMYNVLSYKAIKNIVFMGVHENMCIMNRQFAISHTLSWGFNPVICRENTDTMYDPTRVPYVSHDEGTRLMTEYIEKFWVPSISAYDFIWPRNMK